jgi:hypothetical protein
MRRGRLLALLPTLGLIVACATTPAASPTVTEGEPTGTASGIASEAPSAEPTSSQAGDGGGGGLATVNLHLDAGPHAGDWSADITSGRCAFGYQVLGTFSVASDSLEGTVGFDGIELLIDDAAAAAAGTDRLSVRLTFDEGATEYIVVTIDGRGSATATLADNGDSATVHAEGTFEDGTPMSLDVTCHEPERYP